MQTKEYIRETLKQIIDPELNIDIVTLGLIRDIDLGEYYEELDKHEYIKVLMTLTTPMCPYADHIVSEVKTTIDLLGNGECEVSLSFEPPWTCPPEAKLLLGL
jgi:metal-sulfur cluster biosynthetic enzyme